MSANDDHAANVIRIYATASVEEGIAFLTYKSLAKRLGRSGQERLLGDVLDRVRIRCRENGLPDIATMVVSKDSLEKGLVRPAETAEDKYGTGWLGLREAQARVLTFDWSGWLKGL